MNHHSVLPLVLRAVPFLRPSPPSPPPSGSPHLNVVVLEQDHFRGHLSNVHDFHHHHALWVRVLLFVEPALQAVGLVPCDRWEAFLDLRRLIMMMVMMKRGEKVLGIEEWKR